jgi:Ca-activated chloride channel homolog
MPKLYQVWFAALVAAVLFATPSLAAADPQNQPALVIVLDGSGSMWGKMSKEATTKLDLSKQALSEAVKNVSPNVRLGLASFGHRKAGNCADADLIIEPGPGTVDDIALQIGKLNPRGKGPLNLALTKTAKSLPPDSHGVIFLVHDGLDNCRGDPCAVAEEIAASHPNITIHVASLDLEPAQAATLQCLADKTGGKVTPVTTSAAFNAVIKEAFDVAMRNTNGGPGTDGLADTLDDAQDKADKQRPGLSLKALFRQGDRSQSVPATWQVATADAPKTVVATGRGTTLSKNLEPSNYIVSLTAGLVQQSLNIAVTDDGVSNADVLLDAGMLRFATPPSSSLGPTSAAPPVFYTLRSATAPVEKGDPANEPLWIGYGSRDQSLLVPPGRYRVDIDRGQTKKTADIEVKAGETVPVQFSGDVGQLTLTSLIRQGQSDPPAAPQQPRVINGILYILSTDDPAAPGGRREVARSASPETWFPLSAGTYYVEALLGQARQESRIAIGAGSNIRHAFTFDVVDISLKPMVGNEELGPDLPVSHRIVAIDDGEREVARSSDSQAKFLLPAGRYRIETDVGQQLQKQQTIVVLGANDGGPITVPLKAGRVTLEPEAATLGKLRRIQVRGANQDVVWRGRLSKPKQLILPPGTYQITTGGGPDAQNIGAVTVDEGKSVVVQVRPNS